jgi:hypothetical protein
VNLYILRSFSFQFFVLKITNYSTEVFINFGLDPNTWAVYATLIINVFAILMTFVCTALIEKAGRRPLLVTGFAGTCAVCIVLTIIPLIFVNAFSRRFPRFFIESKHP